LTAAGRRFAILISGRGSNMQALIAASRRGEIAASPAVVVSNVPDAAGLAAARELGVATEVVESRPGVDRAAHDRAVLAVLKDRGVDLVCLAGYMRLLSPELVGAYRHAVMNIHPSLLPAYPGLNAQRQALLHGAKVTGCTVHFVDEHLDTGPIIAQKAVPVEESDTAEILSERILREEHRLYPQAVQWFFEGRLEVHGRVVRVLPGRSG
jgi:phosphoribosylglycinamide formyltransferase-1